MRPVLDSLTVFGAAGWLALAIVWFRSRLATRRVAAQPAPPPEVDDPCRAALEKATAEHDRRLRDVRTDLSAANAKIGQLEEAFDFVVKIMRINRIDVPRLDSYPWNRHS